MEKGREERAVGKGSGEGGGLLDTTYSVHCERCACMQLWGVASVVCLPADLLYIMYAHTRVSVRSDRACGHTSTDYLIYRHTQRQTSSYFFFLILCRSYLEVVLMVERFTGFLISLFLVFL